MNKHLHCPDESHVCQHGEDESCPAMNPPESETPETDAVVHNGFSLARVARSLERRLSLAQTEIKGHIRVEEELKVDLSEAQAQLAAWQEHGKTYGFICGRFECDEAGKYHIFQNEGSEFDKAQARIADQDKQLEEWGDLMDEQHKRIAELEKLLGRWLTGPHVINAPLSLINETKYAALKDRA